MFCLLFSGRLTQPQPASDFPDCFWTWQWHPTKNPPTNFLHWAPESLSAAQIFVYTVPAASIGQNCLFALGRRNKFTPSPANHVDLANISSGGQWTSRAAMARLELMMCCWDDQASLRRSTETRPFSSEDDLRDRAEEEDGGAADPPTSWTCNIIWHLTLAVHAIAPNCYC